MQNTEQSPASQKTHRFRFRSANELFQAMPAVRDDIRARPDDADPLDFLERLMTGDTPEEAVTFASYLLPSREAVWWAHQCLSYLPDALTDQDHHMLLLAENWVREPDEPARCEALESAMQTEVKSPGVWVALAAGWSGGSMAPANLTPVPPPPYLTARSVNAAVLGVLARVELRHRADVLRSYVGMAVRLAEG
jgi:hypothetical protein